MIDWLGKLEEIVTWAVLGVLSAIATFGLWLIRTIFTNQEEIRLLRADLARRDQAREEDRERMTRVENGVIRLETALLERNGDTDG